MSERDKLSIDECLEYQYSPFEPVEKFETGVELNDFSELSDKLVVIGSASPRNRRFHAAFPDSLPLCRLSTSQIKKLLHMSPSQYSEIVTRILKYEEPRRAWEIGLDGEASDNDLSLTKARITAAAAIVHHHISARNDTPSFEVLGKDYNVVGNEMAMERPGFYIPSFAPQNMNLQGWVRQGEGPKPDSPAEQCKKLYHPERPFYTANSTTILKVDKDFYSPEGIAELLAVDTPLSDYYYKKELTFMGLRPTSTIIDGPFVTVYDLIEYYSNYSLKNGGDKLYSIPGVVDWSRPPFRDQLHVWLNSDGFSIFNSLKNLREAIAGGEGGWIPFAHNPSQDVENELVGVSTYGASQLLQRLA